MGGVGMLAGSFALPVMGRIYDEALAAAVKGGIDQAAAQLAAGSAVLRDMTYLPVVLIVLFSALAWHQRGKGAVKMG